MKGVFVLLVVVALVVEVNSQVAWKQLNFTNPPPARVYASSARNAPVPPPYDPSQKNGIVFFGGAGSIEYSPVFNDVWILNAQDNEDDGRAWTEIPVQGDNQPPARCLSSIAIDESQNVLYVFGGFNGTDWFNGELSLPWIASF